MLSAKRIPPSFAEDERGRRLPTDLAKDEPGADGDDDAGGGLELFFVP